MTPTRDQALKILDEFVDNQNLKRHMYAVEACMRTYAQKFDQDSKTVKKWAIAGLLHDADWEKFPKKHPTVIIEHLKKIDAEPGIIQAIASHGNNSPKDLIHSDNSPEDPTNQFTPRKSLMDKVLFAVDEMSGFVIACALVRPDKLDSLEADSVIKKMKDKSFAAAVIREELEEGARDIGVGLKEHIELVIGALRRIKEVFGF